jgi:hypothetical protein
MRKAIIHKHPKEPMYLEITECEEEEVEKTIADLRKFGSRVILVMNNSDVPKLEAYIARWGGGPVGLT